MSDSNREAKLLGKGWDDRFDRRVSLIVVDYTKSALAVGEAKCALISGWVDSALVAKHAVAHQRMGTTLTQMSIKGKVEDPLVVLFARFIAHGVMSQKIAVVRYLDVVAKTDKDSDRMELVFIAKIEMQSNKEAKEISVKMASVMKRLLQTFGLRQFALSRPVWARVEAELINTPMESASWGAWQQKALDESEHVRDYPKF